MAHTLPNVVLIINFITNWYAYKSRYFLEKLFISQQQDTFYLKI